MKETEFLTQQFADGHEMIESTLKDLTSEIAEWQPGGTANSITCLLAHTVYEEDDVLKQTINGGQSLFVSGGWSAKTGIPASAESIWTPDWILNLEAFDAYRQEVRESTRAFLADLDQTALDREMNAWGGTYRVGRMLREMGNHQFSHTGEISVLRGMKGLAGLPI